MCIITSWLELSSYICFWHRVVARNPHGGCSPYARSLWVIGRSDPCRKDPKNRIQTLLGRSTACPRTGKGDGLLEHRSNAFRRNSQEQDIAVAVLSGFVLVLLLVGSDVGPDRTHQNDTEIHRSLLFNSIITERLAMRWNAHAAPHFKSELI